MNSDNKDAIRIVLVSVFLFGLAYGLGKLLDDLPNWIGTILEVPLILGGLGLSVWLWQIIRGDGEKQHTHFQTIIHCMSKIRISEKLRKLGSPGDIGKGTHFEKYIQMLNELDEWADMLDFGNLKRAAISGSIEGVLKNTYRNTGVDHLVAKYLIMSQTIIMKM